MDGQNLSYLHAVKVSAGPHRPATFVHEGSRPEEYGLIILTVGPDISRLETAAGQTYPQLLAPKVNYPKTYVMPCASVSCSGIAKTYNQIHF